ncbi:hypothetical protein PLIIFM63780_005130 [Purpureocillium lilacinum]|nr:hypothetical protein PLIIFM63780_005130 [Purpureocillium lilacinum]
MPALQPLLSLIQRGVDNTTHASNAAGSGDDALQVICAWPVSGQYGPGSRILYYVLIAACVLAQKSVWIRNACLAAALLLPAVAAVHAIVLAALHVDGAVDMDVFGAFQLCSIGILAAPVTVRLSRTYFNDPGRNTIFLWAGLILAGLLSLTVEFYRIGTSSCSEKEAGIPIPRDTHRFPYGNTTCGLVCSVTEGPFSPMRGGSAKDIYVIPAPDGLTFGTATLIAAACCVHAILWLASMMDKILEINFKSVSLRFMERETDGQLNDPIEGTNGATIGSMKKVNHMVRMFLSVVAVPVFGGAGLAILIIGERNFFSPQVKYQNEPWASIGLAAVGSLYLLLKSDGNSTVEGVCKHCAHHTNRSPSSRDSRSLRDSVDDSDRTRSPHVPVAHSATMSSSANDGMSPLRPSFTTLSRYLTGHASQATTVRSDVGGRRKVARMFHAVGKSFNSAAYEMMGTSGFEPTRAGDFPEIPGEANRNRKLKRIRERYNPPRDADGYETPLPRSRSRATSFLNVWSNENAMSSVSPDDVPIIRQSPLSRFRSSTLLILIVVCSAVFTDIFLYGLLVPVLPFALTSRAGVPVSEIPRWNGILLALYNLGLCIGSPAFGFLADRMSSRRLPFLAGLVALAASTLLLCLGRNVAVIAVGRVLQGLSAAICWAVGLALLADSLTERVGWALGWVNWAMTAGFLLSPILGGLAYENAGYYAVYYMAFGLIACDIVLRLFMKEGKAARTQNANVTDEDAPSRETRPVEADLVEPTHERPGGRSLQAGAGVANYWALIKSRRLLASLIGCIMQSASKFAFFAVIPPFVDKTFHWDALAAGLIFLCVLLPGFLSPLVGSVADRYGTKWLSFAGFALSVPLFVCLRFVAENTLSQKVLLGALLTLMGIALTLSSTPLMAEITYVIEDKDKEKPGIWGTKGVYGVGFGLFTTSFALGGVIGSFMAGYLYDGPGWETFGWAFGIWCAGGAVICAFFVGKPAT